MNVLEIMATAGKLRGPVTVSGFDGAVRTYPDPAAAVAATKGVPLRHARGAFFALSVREEGLAAAKIVVDVSERGMLGVRVVTGADEAHVLGRNTFATVVDDDWASRDATPSPRSASDAKKEKPKK